MIFNASYLTFLVLLYSSTSRYPHPAIRSIPCEVHPGAGGTFLNILFLYTGTHKISLQHMFNTVVQVNTVSYKTTRPKIGRSNCISSCIFVCPLESRSRHNPPSWPHPILLDTSSPSPEYPDENVHHALRSRPLNLA